MPNKAIEILIYGHINSLSRPPAAQLVIHVYQFAHLLPGWGIRKGPFFLTLHVTLELGALSSQFEVSPAR